MSISYFLTFFVAIIAPPAQAISHCKTTPLDAAWPTQDDWSALNRSVNGMLLRTTPVASSCWPNNPFDSTVSCNDVKANWSSTAFHAERPESLDYPISANSSCIPPGATGYEESRGCDLDGLPEYILNATINEEVATALQFASERNIRIVVKGTGHDMNGSAISGSGNAGSPSLMSSRLLGRKELAQTPKDDVIGYLKTACLGQNATHGSYVVTKEWMWQQWAPDTGAYANEANPFNRNWKHDFYGPSYGRLLDIKQKYEPSFSMFVYNGVGTESWNYVLNSGLLTYWRPFASSSSENVKSVLQNLGGLGRLEHFRYKSAFQLDPPSEDAPYGAVVLAGNQSETISWLSELNPNYTTYQYNILKPGDPGYISLRCDWYPSCPAELRPKGHDAVVWGNVGLHEDTEKAVSQSWKQLFPNEDLPETIAAPCCAQFAVTRQAILRRSKADFERMRQWLIETLMMDELSGRVFEKLWAYIFTGEAVNCPPPQMCACKYFENIATVMTTNPLLKPTLHVEVAVKPSKAHEVSSAQLRKEVKGWLTRHFDTIQIGIDVSAELSDSDLSHVVDLVEIADYTGPPTSFGHDYHDIKSIDLDIQTYALKVEQESRSRRAFDVTVDDDGQKARILSLPNVALKDAWNSLVFDDRLPSLLLRYLVRMLGMVKQPNLNLAAFNWNRLCLLHGPPGSGKSTFCRALAQKLSIRLSDVFRKATLVEVNTNSMLSKYFGESGKLIGAMFERVHTMAQDPAALVCVIIDEIETIAGSRERSTTGGECNDGLRATNQLLTALDRLRFLPNVIVLCTSNLSTAIDQAFLDRVDIKQLIPCPSPTAIYEIFRSCLNELVRSSILADGKVTASDNSTHELRPRRAVSRVQRNVSSPQLVQDRMSAGSSSQEPVTIPTYSEMFVHWTTRPQSPGSRVWNLAQTCHGLSGRTLRRLPILGLAMHTWGGSVSLHDAVSALEAAVEQELEVLKIKGTQGEQMAG
ncbi:hypothetical protein KC331_g5809 [Hortaea werneckii]|nr:hypothetical protein KC331_g5809 [Hortaea werneckii]